MKAEKQQAPWQGVIQTEAAGGAQVGTVTTISTNGTNYPPTMASYELQIDQSQIAKQEPPKKVRRLACTCPNCKDGDGR